MDSRCFEGIDLERLLHAITWTLYNFATAHKPAIKTILLKYRSQVNVLICFQVYIYQVSATGNRTSA